MTNSLNHRGPDDRNIWQNSEQGIYFGHTRLSILDLSSNGSQPMISNNKKYLISFNGEIYNHLDLRKKINEHLRAKNTFIEWKGHSDTETLVNCFETFGINKTLEFLEGMFAIALYDFHAEELYLIRDIFGEKPLYYGWINNDFVFASELKSLKIHPNFISEIDLKSKSLYLNLSYVPSPFTIYKNINKLSAGNYLKLSKRKINNCDNVIIREWYSKNKNIHKSKSDIYYNNLDKNSDILEEKLKKTVNKFMISDVDIGVFLSSGIDSSLIASLANSVTDQKIQTFTIGFKDKRYDESFDAKQIADYLKTDHHEKIFDKNDLLELVPKLNKIYDEPFADSSQLPTLLLSNLTSKHVKVALTGDGGDELFGGYNRYILSNKYFNTLQYLPKFSKKSISAILDIIPKNFYFIFEKFINNINKNNKIFLYERLNKISSKITYSDSIYSFYYSLISDWYGCPIIKDHDKELISYFDNLKINNLNNQEKMMYLDTMSYLTDDILCKVDRASMSYGLETRIPFLDKDIFKTSWQIPYNQKIKGSKGKIILRNILKKYIPENLISNQKKGFGVPIGELLKNDLRDWAEDLLEKNKLEQNDFNYKYIHKVWEQHLSGRSNNQHKLWNILIFQLFSEQ